MRQERLRWMTFSCSKARCLSGSVELQRRRMGRARGSGEVGPDERPPVPVVPVERPPLPLVDRLHLISEVRREGERERWSSLRTSESVLVLGYGEIATLANVSVRELELESWWTLRLMGGERVGDVGDIVSGDITTGILGSRELGKN